MLTEFNVSIGMFWKCGIVCIQYIVYIYINSTYICMLWHGMISKDGYS